MSALRTVLRLLLVACFIQAAAASAYGNGGEHIDFSRAQIVVPEGLSRTEQAALRMLVEEVSARTLIDLPVGSSWPASSVPVIAVGTAGSLPHVAGPFGAQALQSPSAQAAEGFSIRVRNDVRDAPTVFIIGNDQRGMLFGAGYFLRKSTMERHRLMVPGNLHVDTSPNVPLRGHQLGYRPKTNSYDGFDIDTWEQYIRDLVAFGTNAVELLPPNTDDAAWSPMFPRPPMDMMIRMNDLLVEYDLETWIWYPLMHGDYTVAENVERSLAENDSVFSQLQRVDALFIPGGDPGRAHPEVLFNYLEKQAEVLHRHHPEAEIWVSPQSFDEERMDVFLRLVREEPAWLTGIVYGPQVRLYVTELRQVIPDRYPIRRYPDITHTYDAQYPVPFWDHAFAATQNREPINPRPMDQAAIYRAPGRDTYDGFITYSEGVNDDVNKIIWSALGWDPEADVVEILQDYSRYFIGPAYTHDFAQALLDLENNWKGPLLTNASVNTTLGRFQAMERSASPQVRMNWRFILAQFRAYYDAYNRSRLIYETHLEDRAMEALRRAPRIGSALAMQEAERILLESKLQPVAEDVRQRLFELAEALFQTISYQKSVDKYFAIGVRRGANLDLMDWPLNNSNWLADQFNRIKELENERARLEEIDLIVNWTNPGPGGFYTDLGDWASQSNVVMDGDYDRDPAFLSSTFVGFAVGWERTRNFRVSWARYMQTLYDRPLKMQYANLDPEAQYELRATYLNQYVDQSVRLVANGTIEVHPYVVKDFPVHQVRVDIPQEATSGGALTLEWIQDLGMGGTGRGNQLGEVWLIKKENAAAP